MNAASSLPLTKIAAHLAVAMGFLEFGGTALAHAVLISPYLALPVILLSAALYALASFAMVKAFTLGHAGLFGTPVPGSWRDRVAGTACVLMVIPCSMAILFAPLMGVS